MSQPAKNFKISPWCRGLAAFYVFCVTLLGLSLAQQILRFTHAERRK